MSKRLPTLALLLLAAAWIWFSRLPAGYAAAGRIPVPRAGFPAPPFALQDTQGRIVNLSDLRGKPLILNLWASWCPPCRAEMPALEAVYREYAADGLLVVGLNTTYQDDPAAALDFVAELGLSFPILLDLDGAVSEAYQLQAMPTTFFIGADGVITEVVVGGPIAEALLRVRAQQLLEGAGS